MIRAGMDSWALHAGPSPHPLHPPGKCGPPNALLTLILSIPASMRSCSTSFRACAMLLVVDIVCHRFQAPALENARGSKGEKGWFVAPCRSFPNGQGEPRGSEASPLCTRISCNTHETVAQAAWEGTLWLSAGHFCLVSPGIFLQNPLYMGF